MKTPRLCLHSVFIPFENNQEKKVSFKNELGKRRCALCVFVFVCLKVGEGV